MDCAYHVEDPRQRVASYAAVLVLTKAAAQDVDLSTAQLGAIVTAFLPSVETAKLRAWSEMDMAQAVRTIKIDLLRHQIALAEAGTGSQAVAPGTRLASRRRKPANGRQALSEEDISRLDDEISQSVVASVFKFMTMRAFDPDWYTPYLEETVAF